MTDTISNVRKHNGAVGLTDRIKSALATIAPEGQTLTVAQLAPLDQFHTRGILATTELATAAQSSGATTPRRMFVESYARTSQMFTETDFRPELRKISVPTLLVHGDNDQSTPIEATARKTVPLITGCQLKVYEGAAHGLPFTHADQLNADLLAFAKG